MTARPFGPSIEGNQVRFSLWAPDAKTVSLEVIGQEAQAMSDAEDGWKEAVARGGVGLRYRFRIGDIAFPDPASRLQQGGVHGWSVVTMPHTAAPWSGRPWHETVLYECHPGLMGGFRGIAERLSALAALGITAIELMPISAFSGARNWGYDGVLPYAPVEHYGTPEDLRTLIARAHQLDLSIFLDVVYNHFGPDGNYLSLYAKAFFREDCSTPWGPAIDFRKPVVRRFFSDNARQWLFEYGFDGLRFDAAHAIIDNGWLKELAHELRSEAGDRHVHLVLENEDNIASHLRHGFDAQWNDDFHHAFHVLLTGETHGYYQDFADRPATLLARALSEGFIYQGQASANRQGRPRGETSANLPPSAFVNFLQNHDQIGNRALGERLTVLANPAALKAAVALQLLAPQVPLIFMGEEIGSRAPFLYFTDHGPELAQAVREGRAREFADVANGGRDIPDPNAPESFTASEPERDAPGRDAWLMLYRELLTLRYQLIVPGLERAHALSAKAVGDKAVMAQWCLGNGAILTLAVNLGAEAVEADLPSGTPFWGKPAEGIPPCQTLAWIDQRS